MPQTRLIDRLKEGETVMVCRHLYELSSCKVSVRLSDQTYTEFTPASEFTRNDGSKGKAKFYVKCDGCRFGRRPGEVDYIETYFHDGRFQVADVKREKERAS